MVHFLLVPQPCKLILLSIEAKHSTVLVRSPPLIIERILPDGIEALDSLVSRGSLCFENDSGSILTNDHDVIIQVAELLTRAPSGNEKFRGDQTGESLCQ